MPRSLALFTLFISSACAAILPEQLGPNHRVSSEPKPVEGLHEMWDEYGLQACEHGSYGQFGITACQFKDTTGAFAAAEFLKSPNAVLGNYVVSCSGKCTPALKDWLSAKLPNFSRSRYPVLENYLPQQGLIAGSKRYILGPASLAQFEPRIPASAIAFDFSPEAQLARYRSAGGEQSMAIISYPTPQIARQQVAVLEKLPDAVVKRTGPIVSLVLAPGNQAAAGLLLAKVDYHASVSFDDQPLPLIITPQTAGQMVLAILSLAGIVVGFCLLSGLAFGGFRVLSKRFGHSDATTAMITLHLGDK